MAGFIKRIRSLSFQGIAEAALFRAIALPENIIKKWYYHMFAENINGSVLFRQFRNSGEKPKIFVDPGSRCSITEIIQRHYPHIKKDLVLEADAICAHQFDLLGSGPKIVKSPFLASKRQGYIPIDWHVDFKTGYRWEPRKFYLDIEIPQGLADIKVPWELSRFEHLTSLGQAYWITGDERYTSEFINQTNDWIDSNQPQCGVNWACTMDVAMRLVNWIFGYQFFKDSKLITDEFLKKLLKSFLTHSRHIRINLENRKRIVNNHYISDIVGLLFLAVALPEVKEAEGWRQFGLREIKKEMQKQVYSDGCNFEGSTCYHRFALELFFYTTMAIVINDRGFDGKNHKEVSEGIFGKSYTEKLYKMFEVVLYLVKPNNKMAQVGDNDSGRLFSLSRQELLDMRYLLTYAAIFFKDCKFKVKEFGFCIDALWVFGEEGYKAWQGLEENQLVNIRSRAFPKGGWYIMRNLHDYMIISCGKNGLNGTGGHNHNDKLSFELCIDNEDIVVDPGTYTYTPEPKIRNMFRSTAYHNTAVIDGKEQNRINERSLFELRNDSKAACLKWLDNTEEDSFIGEHSGYARLPEPIMHRRSIRFLKQQTRWVIKDEFYLLVQRGRISNLSQYCTGHIFDWHFYFAPQIIPEEISAGLYLLKGAKSTVSLKICNLTDEYQALIEDGWYSYGYGKKLQSKTLKLVCKHVIPFQQEFEITSPFH